MQRYGKKQEGGVKKLSNEILGVMDIFIVFILMMVDLHIQTVHFKYLQLMYVNYMSITLLIYSLYS